MENRIFPLFTQPELFFLNFPADQMRGLSENELCIGWG